MEEWKCSQPYLDLLFEYIVNCGCKVGGWWDREKYGFELDEEDIADRQYVIDILSKPLREGIMKNSIINEIFQYV